MAYMIGPDERDDPHRIILTAHELDMVAEALSEYSLLLRTDGEADHADRFARLGGFISGVLERAYRCPDPRPLAPVLTFKPRE